MYFMLGFHLVCVLIIITVIGLINASQELRSPFPTFYFCAKDICKKVFCFRQQKLLLPTRLSRKSNSFFCKHQKPIWDAGLLLNVIEADLGGGGRQVQGHGKRTHWGFFHPSCKTSFVSACTVYSQIQGSV